MDKKSKIAMAEKDLLAGMSLTQKDAIKRHNNYRLAAIIHILRANGLDIENVNEHLLQSNGKRMYARYRIPPQPCMRCGKERQARVSPQGSRAQVSYRPCRGSRNGQSAVQTFAQTDRPFL